ncbi:MAG: flagellar biosynthetic protein FliO [Opitutales bacterium]
MKVCRQIAALLFLLPTLALSPVLLCGDDFARADVLLASEPQFEWPKWLTIVGALLLLGTVAYFLSTFVRNRRFGPFKRAGSKRLRVAEVCALGNRQFVFVIECAGERHLVGAWTNGIRHLSRLPKDSEESFEAKLDELEPPDEEDDQG